jgi:hypothetical protein
MLDSLGIAITIIKKSIDPEGKFIGSALYEMTGQQLQESLAFAYREGRKMTRPS